MKILASRLAERAGYARCVVVACPRYETVKPIGEHWYRGEYFRISHSES